MENYLSEYLPILLFIIIGFAIAIGMTTLSFVVGERKPDNEKLSAYECGFEAFDDARGRFDVRFYLVAILFIIFDLEVAFLSSPRLHAHVNKLINNAIPRQSIMIKVLTLPILTNTSYII